MVATSGGKHSSTRGRYSAIADNLKPTTLEDVILYLERYTNSGPYFQTLDGLVLRRQ